MSNNKKLILEKITLFNFSRFHKQNSFKKRVSFRLDNFFSQLKSICVQKKIQIIKLFCIRSNLIVIFRSKSGSYNTVFVNKTENKQTNKQKNMILLLLCQFIFLVLQLQVNGKPQFTSFFLFNYNKNS